MENFEKKLNEEQKLQNKTNEFLKENELPDYSKHLIKNLLKQNIEIKPSFVKVLKNFYQRINNKAQKESISHEEVMNIIKKIHTRFFDIITRSQLENSEDGIIKKKNKPSTAVVTSIYKPNIKLDRILELAEREIFEIKEISSNEYYEALKNIYMAKGLPKEEEVIEFIDFVEENNLNMKSLSAMLTGQVIPKIEDLKEFKNFLILLKKIK